LHQPVIRAAGWPLMSLGVRLMCRANAKKPIGILRFTGDGQVGFNPRNTETESAS